MKSVSEMNLAEVTLAILGAAVNIPDGLYARAQYLAKEELRALLDAPTKDYVLINGMYFSHAEILEWREKACREAEAAQSQGEPVAYLDLEKFEYGGMVYATKMRVNHRQSAVGVIPTNKKK